MLRAMSSFLHDVEIDWCWYLLGDDERAIARKHEALLQSDRQAHTVESAQLALAAAARDLPGRLLRMRAIDDNHTYYWQVIEGEVYPGHEFEEAGMYPGELSAEDFHAAGVTIVATPIAIPDAMVAEIAARATTLSEVVQDARGAGGIPRAGRAASRALDLFAGRFVGGASRSREDRGADRVVSRAARGDRRVRAAGRVVPCRM
jgi:hypothetical protein